MFKQNTIASNKYLGFTPPCDKFMKLEESVSGGDNFSEENRDKEGGAAAASSWGLGYWLFG